MPMLDPLLWCACHITSIGSLLGTGFLVTVPSEALHGVRYGYVVTAHHVVRSQLEVSVETADPNRDGQSYDPVPVDSWRQPLVNVDLAVAVFHPRDNTHLALELENHVAPNGLINTPRIGSPIFYLGVFQPLNVLMARAGTIGAVNVAVPNADGYPSLGHLVDCRSYDGFSGSPCFVQVTVATDQVQLLPFNADNLMAQTTALGYHYVLGGMFISHFSDEQQAGGIASRYGVGVMLRGNEIHAALG